MTPEQAGKTNRKGAPASGDVAVKGIAQSWTNPGSKGGVSRPSLGRLSSDSDHCAGHHGKSGKDPC